MTSEELQSNITAIVSDNLFGIEMFAVLYANNNFELRKFQITDSLKDIVGKKISETLTNEILNEDFNLMSVQDIDEKLKVYYEIIQDDSFSPFFFLNVDLDKQKKYNEKEQPQLKGFCIKVNRNDNFLWIYQHKYSTTLINRSSSVFAILNGSVYEPLNCDVVKLESKIDILLFRNSLVTKNLNLLQSVFGFEKYVRKSAAQVIESIKSINIISDLSKLIDLSNQQKLTTAKKLMKAAKSPVLQIPKDELLNKLKTMDYYSKHIKIDENTKKILVSSKSDVREFLKMLNDEILKSELTGNDYESSVKEKIIKND